MGNWDHKRCPLQEGNLYCSEGPLREVSLYYPCSLKLTSAMLYNAFWASGIDLTVHVGARGRWVKPSVYTLLPEE